MKRIVIVFGLIAGLITAGWLVLAFATGLNTDFDSGMFLGYASMILAFSLIFAGIKTYRDKYNGGTISFGKGFRIGILITLIASTMYVSTWLIMYHNFIPDFTEKYTQHMLERMAKENTPAQEIALKKAEMARFNEMYKNPLFNALVTYMEILPVGALISLIAAWILKRKKGQVQDLQMAGQASLH